MVPTQAFYYLQSHFPISGSSTLVETQYTPRRPTNLRQADSTTYAATSITLEWNAPQDTGCSPVTSYVIEYYNGLAWTTAGTSTTTVGVANGLTAGQLVQLRVTALNAIPPNTGIPSEPISLTPSALPSAPTFIKVDVYGAHSLLLSWNVPANTGANDSVIVPITDYSLEVDEGFGSGFVRITETPHITTQFLHESLIQGHLYSYRIKAKNLMGFGDYSQTFSFIPRDVPAKPPKAPINLPLQTTRSVIYLHFDQLAPEDQGGSAITSYNFYIDDGADGPFGGQYQVLPSLSTWDTSQLSLQSGRIYKFKYSATNVHGEGPLSDEVSILLAEKPSQPILLTRVGKTTLPAGQIKVTWALPSDEGGTPVTGYRIYLSGALLYDASQQSTLNSFAFTNLSVG